MYPDISVQKPHQNLLKGDSREGKSALDQVTSLDETQLPAQAANIISSSRHKNLLLEERKEFQEPVPTSTASWPPGAGSTESSKEDCPVLTQGSGYNPLYRTSGVQDYIQEG